jgi:YesN/AraC family two-component response regulator
MRAIVLGGRVDSAHNGDMDAALRVLLADDAAEIRQLLRLTLELDGRFEVVGEAEDGAQAIAMTSSQRPDVVILDVSMPIMDGLQAIPEISRTSPATKIIVLSSHEDDTSDAALSLGADAYLVKGEATHENVVPRIIDLYDRALTRESSSLDSSL